jgi:hypothetical protein
MQTSFTKKNEYPNNSNSNNKRKTESIHDTIAILQTCRASCLDKPEIGRAEG